ncbi:uncharacterized protein LOC133839438 [Drosophila sulfurigaster albostrigata]|uniref:uncharacterized protein LOC133839438 n=1 Tax=Drosophila sulfurigaster albostrigata TaxID=89887 RepID=UPI002D21CDF9|nr:uncharacterized protein LOC133839438 [Drosophila sulfurigaster albostrigata]
MTQEQASYSFSTCFHKERIWSLQTWHVYRDGLSAEGLLTLAANRCKLCYGLVVFPGAVSAGSSVLRWSSIPGPQSAQSISPPILTAVYNIRNASLTEKQNSCRAIENCAKTKGNPKQTIDDGPQLDPGVPTLPEMATSATSPFALATTSVAAPHPA